MDKDNPIRVLVVYSHEILRIGIMTLLEREHDIQVTAEASGLADALAAVVQTAVDVVLLDSQFGRNQNLHFIDELIGRGGNRKVLMLAIIDDADTHRRGLQHGASGVFTANQPVATLPKAIRRVHAGELWIDREMTSSLFSELRTNKNGLLENRLHSLTAREHKIAQLAAQGHPAKKIATFLNISDKTVRNQLVQVYSKLGVSGRLELALKAGQFGLHSEKGQTA